MLAGQLGPGDQGIGVLLPEPGDEPGVDLRGPGEDLVKLAQLRLSHGIPRINADEAMNIGEVEVHQRCGVVVRRDDGVELRDSVATAVVQLPDKLLDHRELVRQGHDRFRVLRRVDRWIDRRHVPVGQRRSRLAAGFRLNHLSSIVLRTL